MVENLGLVGMVYNIACNCQLLSRSGEQLQFILDSANASLYSERHSDTIRLALQNYFGGQLSVSIEVGEPTAETPAMITARAAAERQLLAVAEIEGDRRLQALITRFDGVLDPASIAPMDS